MANMSYCRFRNTYNDMMDCIDAIYDNEALSDDEFIACQNMFEKILEFLEDYDICEVDWDEFNKWLDTIDRR
ncbi:hypothetical protein IJD44_01375 [bacterium]|nr:hypothetical protein [bacterium]